MSGGFFEGVAAAGGHEPPDVDTSVAHQARVYDYLIGGKDNFAADRKMGDMVIETNPNLVATARANREFLGRAVRFLATEAGIRQFLDVGTGIPAANNTHEVAQAVAPESRVVYVDNDPIVLVHARALLASTPEGKTAYLDADARNPGPILAQAAKTLDFSQPVAIMLLSILQVLDDPYALASTLLDAVPAGSYLSITIPASDIQAEAQAALARRVAEARPEAAALGFRTRAEVTRFFDGLELMEPGVVPVNQWRPVPGGTPQAPALPCYGGVGRKR